MRRCYFLFFLLLISLTYGSLQATILSSGSGLSIIAPTTITEPGNYRLANDILGTITVAADFVFINLENRRIAPGGANGIEIPNQTQVTITNGIIENAACGIQIQDSRNINVQGISILSSATGISVLTTTGVRLENISITENTAVALALNNSNNASVRESSFIFNTVSCVIDIINSSDVTFANVAVNENILTGSPFTAVSVVNCNNCRLNGTTVNNNTAVSPDQNFCGVSMQNDQIVEIVSIVISANQSAGDFEGMMIAGSQGITVQDVCSTSNVASGSSLVSINITESSANVTLSDSQFNNNIALAGTACGVSNKNSDIVVCKNCSVNKNRSMKEAIGFSINNSKNTVCDSCMSFSNVSTSSCAIGFSSKESIRTTIRGSFANDNIGSTTGIGIQMTGEFNSVLLENCTEGNTGMLSEGIGIDFVDTVSCTIRNCISLNNVGSSAANSFGVRVCNFNSVLTTAMFTNQAQGQAGNNFMVSPGSKPLVNFDVNNGTFNSPPTSLDNISVE